MHDTIAAHIDAHWREYGYARKPNKYIALSFDDGPCAPADSGGTAALLDTLAAQKVAATFFVIGEQVRRHSAAAARIAAAGHEIGCHGDTHIRLGNETAAVIQSQLCAAVESIHQICGTFPRLFRAPYLDHGTALAHVCAAMGMALIDGDCHNDWPGSVEEIKESVLAEPQDGGIIILHENNTSQGNTMAALPHIIAGLRDRGFWIMTVSQLAAVKNNAPQAGMRYRYWSTMMP